MRSVRDAGFEVGVYGWDCARWTERVLERDFRWTEEALQRACAAFERVFGEPPRTHAAPGWQMNRHAFRLTQRLGFDYASDTRGEAPFVPIVEAEPVACPQVPTTLQRFGELIGRDGVSLENVHEKLLLATAATGSGEHVFTLVAEHDAVLPLSACERLFAGWRALGCEITSLRALVEDLDRKSLGHHVVLAEPAPGGRGTIAVQGPVFLA